MSAEKLEDRFTQPPGWRWHHFTRKGRKIRFGSVFPEDKIPDAVVVCLPGLGEFGEKYFETARNFLNMNLAFWVIDWMGQGGSGRYLENPHKRHISAFQDDVDDLLHFYTQYVKHACVHPDVGRIPVAMLAHSMGGLIGLHFLSQHPDIFECAAFSAPLTGIKNVPTAYTPLAAALSSLCGTCYVPGGHDSAMDDNPLGDIAPLTLDPVRTDIQSAWFNKNANLRIGAVTYGWVYQALLSCGALKKEKLLKAIQTPCLFALAEQDHLVSNSCARKIADALTHADILELPDARHEILMERDEIRNAFINAFYALIKDRIINRPETLKPF